MLQRSYEMRDCETIRLITAPQQGSFRFGPVLGALSLSLLLHGLLLSLPVSHGGASLSRRVLTVHLVAAVATRSPLLDGPVSAHLSQTEGSGAGAALLAGLPRYYTADELDERPALSSVIDTDIPLPPGEAFVATARFRLYLDAAGGVDKVVVEQSGLPPDVLNELRRRFRAARATPGRLKGQPVPSQVEIRLKVEGE